LTAVKVSVPLPALVMPPRPEIAVASVPPESRCRLRPFDVGQRELSGRVFENFGERA